MACLTRPASTNSVCVAAAIEYGQALARATQLPAGKAPGGRRRRYCAAPSSPTCATPPPELKKAEPLKLLIEPINRSTSPASSSTATAQARAILDEVGADNAFHQYDIYHAQRMEGELRGTMAKHPRARIAHPAADNPAATNPAPARSTTPSCSAT